MFNNYKYNMCSAPGDVFFSDYGVPAVQEVALDRDGVSVRKLAPSIPRYTALCSRIGHFPDGRCLGRV